VGRDVDEVSPGLKLCLTMVAQNTKSLSEGTIGRNCQAWNWNRSRVGKVRGKKREKQDSLLEMNTRFSRVLGPVAPAWGWEGFKKERKDSFRGGRMGVETGLASSHPAFTLGFSLVLVFHSN